MRQRELRADRDGYFRRNIGFKRTPTGRSQPKINLGRNKRQAQERLGLISAIWRRQELEAQQVGEEPVWDALSLAISVAIGEGRREYLLDKLHPAQDANAYAHFVEAVARLYPEIQILPGDEQVYRQGKAVEHAKLKQIENEERELLEAVKETREAILETPGNDVKYVHLLDDRTLHQALDAYCDFIRASKFDVSEGAINDTGKNKLNMVKQIKTYLEDRPLTRLESFEQLDALFGVLRHRPLTHRYKRPMRKKTASNLIGELDQFFRWLDRAAKWEWKLPSDHHKISHKPLDLESDGDHDVSEIPVYTVGQLTTLYEYATPLERVILLLGLNCAFGADQIGRLKIGEIVERKGAHYIQRIRKKKKVRGRHWLFAATLEGIRYAINERSDLPTDYVLVNRRGKPLWRKTKSGNRSRDIPNAWYRLLDRVQLDHPDFPRHGFNTIRDTSADMIRRIAGEEAASIHLTHRHQSRDRNLRRYTNAPWKIVFAAQRKLERRLARVFSAVAQPWADREHQYVTVQQIKEMRRLVREGKPVSEVAEMVKVSPSTVYRWANPSNLRSAEKETRNAEEQHRS
jgi:DNA invertase Pin-like site-specific DNA recombinase